MIIAGTSLTVYPAATFAQFLKHDRIVIINKSSTYMDLKALLTIHDNVGDVLDNCVPKRVSRAKPKAKTASKAKSKPAAKTGAKAASKTKTTTASKAPVKSKTASASKSGTKTSKPTAKKPSKSKT